MKVSECCGAIPWMDMDVCHECHKHSEFIDEDQYDELQNVKEDNRKDTL